MHDGMAEPSGGRNQISGHIHDSTGLTSRPLDFSLPGKVTPAFDKPPVFQFSL